MIIDIDMHQMLADIGFADSRSIFIEVTGITSLSEYNPNDAYRLSDEEAYYFLIKYPKYVKRI